MIIVHLVVILVKIGSVVHVRLPRVSHVRRTLDRRALLVLRRVSVFATLGHTVRVEARARPVLQGNTPLRSVRMTSRRVRRVPKTPASRAVDATH